MLQTIVNVKMDNALEQEFEFVWNETEKNGSKTHEELEMREHS
jgi:hypothetical protein